MNLIEEFRKISGGKSSLDLGYSPYKIRAKNEKCPNPTCTKGTKHCSKCKRLGIFVCGTTAKGHRVMHYGHDWNFREGAIYHKKLTDRQYGDSEEDVGRVFHPHDENIVKNKYFDLRH